MSTAVTTDTRAAKSKKKGTAVHARAAVPRPAALPCSLLLRVVDNGMNAIQMEERSDVQIAGVDPSWSIQVQLGRVATGVSAGGAPDAVLQACITHMGEPPACQQIRYHPSVHPELRLTERA